MFPGYPDFGSDLSKQAKQARRTSHTSRDGEVEVLPAFAESHFESADGAGRAEASLPERSPSRFAGPA